ncbi:DUF4003 domain-containing protein [Bhargavaea beijingensis]|uniref:DUF4003 domain-containing protein n=1 Tax=Bhargavaea beijingensis TaxID=426756 RepID=UPI0022250D2A|nr:DUF4003 domain-containing protein [Bhargavaea beijingensis]MCW1928979.1 DUF4003 domain-containing protein [Bhargavaea beijingensis]
MEATMIKNRYEAIYPKLTNLFSWTIDKRVLLSIAGIYALGEKEFDARRLREVADALKKRSGLFSPVRGQFHPLIAALLDASGEGAQELAENLFEKQEILRELGFRNTIHSYLAATLLPDEEREARREAIAGKMLYDEMKRRHRFLTSDDDYTFAVLLGSQADHPSELADRMHRYYQDLKMHGFRFGNELQWMSQTITYGNAAYEESRSTTASEIRGRLKSEGLKVKPIHYPAIGLLTVFHVEQSQVDRIVETAKTLSEMKLFRWYKEMALSAAIQSVLMEMTTGEQAAHIGIAASVEQVLRAQQAIMASSGAAAATAASSSGGGGDGGS